ncbi:MAG: pyridoxal phosphate-dependent aminotransferase [Thermoplasmatota archaeon]
MFNVHDFFSNVSDMNIPIRLDAGQPDITVHKGIIDHTVNSLYNGETGYTKSIGIDELREKIANFENVKKEEIVVGSGSKILLTSVISNYDKIGIVSPHWQAYEKAALRLSNEIKIIKTTLNNNWVLDFDESDIDLLVLNYPNNPTGKILDKNQIKEIIDFCRDNDIKILADEVYKDIVFKDFTTIKEMYDEVITVRGFSKLYSMTGFRLGYAIGDKKDIDVIKNFIEITTNSVPVFIQKGGCKAIDLHDDIKEQVKRTYEKRKKIAVRELDENIFDFAVPDGTFYIFIKTGTDGVTFTNKLLEKGVAVFPGAAFGDYDDFIRVSLVSDRIKKGIEIVNEVGREVLDEK